MGQKCLVSVSRQKEISNFDLGHPVDKTLEISGFSASQILCEINFGHFEALF